MEGKVYDLEDRTLQFAKRILYMTRELSRNRMNDILVKQIVRSGTSVGANYREANDSLGKKDFVYRMRIARKEAKETTYWLILLMEINESVAMRMRSLHEESIELTKILSSIIKKSV